jgi:2-desacetyl-2-hydroxyethyl bacteriochlorophyllide A dehydrogenase
VYFNKPHQVQILEEPIPKPAQDEVLIQTLYSGISSGTEMLFYRGLMPTDTEFDSNIPSLQHRLNYPFKYGYCSVGTVLETKNKNLKNRLVFVLNPHEHYFCAKEDQLLLIPEQISAQEALFIPNMETAINLVLDGSPLIGERVLVLGLGIVGLLTSALLHQFPLTTLAGVDLYTQRLQWAKELGMHLALNAKQSDLEQQLKAHSFDLIYELTGNPEALNSAIASAIYEGRIVLGSWYGTKPCTLDLGGKFHRNRIKIIASQVSTIASELQGRWTKARRFDLVFSMLEKIKPARFISHQFHITKADKAYQLIEKKPEETLFIALTYEE